MNISLFGIPNKRAIYALLGDGAGVENDTIVTCASNGRSVVLMNEK